ncbi:diacylglycerol/lipid kinase family protein [Devosia rhizoryzae]|uniref:Diacylglycerol kinase family lipid kinase n=1 Tax=Devosia rhizoryzae TaxID=2774137 RepID=A0ABX7C7S7_9HYPH|nr:diacylglycerol kinase family protein [Devosia rhizoryzae]QQR39797.1 diacylglycerol kinase family lipid kinase [Devosia rhizoryzae]
MRFRAVLNRHGGTLRTMNLDAFAAQAKAIFTDAGQTLECHIVEGSNVLAELTAAADDPSVDVIIAAGGDGTISSAAAVAFRSGKPIGVLPAGTMNLFARAIGMPLDLVEALRTISAGEVRHIDIATANGQPFVHQFSVGIHARLVRIRDGMIYRSRAGKILASLRAIAAAVVNPPRFEVELNGPIGRISQTASGIIVSNNPLNNAPLPVAATLNSGLLGVYVAESVTTNELLNLGLDVVTGRWRNNARISEYEVPRLTLRFPQRKRGVQAVVDGELIALEKEVRFELHPEALPVVGASR